MGCNCGGNKKIVAQPTTVYKSTPIYKTTSIYKAAQDAVNKKMQSISNQNQEDSRK
ncbi:hypothetical protein [Bacillus salipaludis]|uniref:Uncharacterized protein n=1 Tax=Bacillus salipaludis TaxID=2547811 RepID=A0AA90R097_9BACI|nr:hypothetical protein [Bacillus salipaludis]MDQ6598597.1 hypothetical protein [Bacillus salipaludis]